jgi:hypothetical protein
MPRDLELIESDGKFKYVEKTTRNEFKGHVTKELEVGDMFEIIGRDGFVEKHEIKEKELTTESYLIVVTEEVII